MRSIEIVITQDGKIVAEAQGFQGEACLEATQSLIEGLGTVTSDEPTPELYEQERCSVGS